MVVIVVVISFDGVSSMDDRDLDRGADGARC